MFDPVKPVKTKNHGWARILATDSTAITSEGTKIPIIAEYEYISIPLGEKNKTIAYFTQEGVHIENTLSFYKFKSDNYDLINKPE